MRIVAENHGGSKEIFLYTHHGKAERGESDDAHYYQYNEYDDYGHGPLIVIIIVVVVFFCLLSNLYFSFFILSTHVCECKGGRVRQHVVPEVTESVPQLKRQKRIHDCVDYKFCFIV